MMKLLPLLALVGCGSAELEAERDALKERVGTLERELDQVSQQKESLDRRVTALQSQLTSQQSDLKSEMERLQEELSTLNRSEMFRRMGISPGDKLTAVLKTTMGDIECKLYPDKSPRTVMNFVTLAEGTRPWTDPRTREMTNRPLYEDVIFHRVIPGFMIQGGDPQGSGMGGPGYKFADETDNGLTFDQEGLLAMANSGPNTNGSQFFITEGDRLPSHLNGRHTIFGECTNLDVVKTIARVQTNRRKKPLKDVVIERIEIQR